MNCMMPSMTHSQSKSIIECVWVAFVWVVAIFLFRLKLLFTEWELRHHWYEKRWQIKPTWQIIEQEFAVNPIFKQTVTITPKGCTVTSPFPACPSFTVQREGKGFVKLLPDGYNLYLFHKREKKRRAYYRGHAYRQEGSAYFLRENYSTEDWSLLVAKLQEWKYI